MNFMHFRLKNEFLPIYFAFFHFVVENLSAQLLRRSPIFYQSTIHFLFYFFYFEKYLISYS